MRALIFESPAPTAAQTTVRDIDEPVAAPGEVLIGVEYAGINYIDVMARRGDPGYASGWPYVPGLEVSGSVLALGSSESRLAVGDRVSAFTSGGGLADVAIADENLVVPLPPNVDGSLAAAAPLMLSTAMLLLKGAAHLQPGDSVLMHSAGGGVGSAVAQLAPVLGGGLLVGTVANQHKAAPAVAAGWQHVLVRDDTLEDRLAELAPSGVDVILDPLGTDTLDVDIRSAAAGGRIVIFGNPGGRPLAPLPAVGTLIGRNLSIGGFSISRLAELAPRRVARALGDVLALLAQAQVKVPLTVVDGLDRAADTHDLLAHGRSVGKYVVKVAGARQVAQPETAPAAHAARTPPQ